MSPDNFDPSNNQQRAKQKMGELMAEHREQFGPSRVDDPLSKEDKAAAEAAAREGQALFQVYARVPQEELTRIVDEAVKRQASFSAGLSPSMQMKLTYLALGFLGGVAQNATWDILKHFIPYLHTFFMASEPTDYMRRCHEAWDQVRDAAPVELRDFHKDHRRGLMSLRAETWTRLEKDIQETELGTVLDEFKIRLFLEDLESRLFVPVRS